MFWIVNQLRTYPYVLYIFKWRRKSNVKLHITKLNIVPKSSDLYIKCEEEAMIVTFSDFSSKLTSSTQIYCIWSPHLNLSYLVWNESFIRFFYAQIDHFLNVYTKHRFCNNCNDYCTHIIPKQSNKKMPLDTRVDSRDL